MLRIIRAKLDFELREITSNGLTTFINPVSYLKARKEIATYEQFDYLLADGWLFVALLKTIGIKTRRYSFDMTSLASILFDRATDERKGVFFLGAKPDEIEQFIHTINERYPDLNILGYRHGYFTDANERRQVIENIKKLSPAIVIAGLGVPLQEKFMVDLRNAGWIGCGYTCGGFIHQTTNRLYYYPSWINNLNLRMPYRLLKEPHFRKRLPDYLLFIFYFVFDYYKFKKKT